MILFSGGVNGFISPNTGAMLVGISLSAAKSDRHHHQPGRIVHLIITYRQEFSTKLGPGAGIQRFGAAMSPDMSVLQKMSSDTKMLNVTSVQAATSKRSATNLTCPRMSPFPIPSTCPFRIMFMPSYPPMVRRAVLKLKKPSPGLTRRFMNRRHCSTILLRYLHYRQNGPSRNNGRILRRFVCPKE
jgi:hypothetical protein